MENLQLRQRLNTETQERGGCAQKAMKPPSSNVIRSYDVPLVDPNSHFDQPLQLKHLLQEQVSLLLLQIFPDL